MRLHPNAKLTPTARELRVRRVREEQWPVAEAAEPAWEVSQEVEVPLSTVSRHLQQLGLGRIWRLEEELEPPQRYEPTRLARAEVLPSENAVCATAFFRRALGGFESLGIRCERVLPDNAKCYGSKLFRTPCEQQEIRQSFTKPFTPKTNGKAERFLQTLKRRWAHRYTNRTSAMRAASLRPWVTHYNHQRPHRALGKKPPRARLREARQQRA